MSQILFSVLWVLLTGLWDFQDTVFPRIIAGGDYYFFCKKRGRLFDYYFKHCSLADQNILFCFPIKLKNDYIK